MRSVQEFDRAKEEIKAASRAEARYSSKIRWPFHSFEGYADGGTERSQLVPRRSPTRDEEFDVSDLLHIYNKHNYAPAFTEENAGLRAHYDFGEYNWEEDEDENEDENLDEDEHDIEDKQGREIEDKQAVSLG